MRSQAKEGVLLHKITFKAKLIEFEAIDFMKHFREGVGKALKDAALELLMEVIRRVPQYTGMSRGAFRPLATWLGQNLPINPHPKAQYYERSFYKARQEMKDQSRNYTRTPEAGATSATGLSITEDGDFVTFDYGVGFVHWLNDFWPNPLSTAVQQWPYQSMFEGRRAMERVFKAAVRRYLPTMAMYTLAASISGSSRAPALMPSKQGQRLAHKKRTYSRV